MANRKRDDEGRFTSDSWMNAARERPFKSAAVAAGVAAAGAFLWSRRGQIGDAVSNGMDSFSEMKSNRISFGTEQRSQDQIAEEAMSLKATGRTDRHPADPVVQQQSKAGAIAY